MKTLKKVLKGILITLSVLLLAFLGLIAYAVISDYKPAESELLAQPGDPSVLDDSASLTLLTWNIGYAGLDKDMDFFYDGGTKVITPEKNCIANLAGIADFLKSNDTVDFMLLQEIDRNSKRSYRTDQFEKISAILPDYEKYFAKNYDVFFVPLPPSNPMGKVVSGMALYSEYLPISATRFSLPGKYGFPVQLFQLDRCFIESRYKVENGRELVLINTHNEAFDSEGTIRKAQMERLRELVLDEYSKGNYVITGGDWNHHPPDFKPAFTANNGFTGLVGNFNLMGIDSDFLPAEWQWLFDSSEPSFRTVVTAYDPASTPTSICDFFLISPNIEAVSVKCQQLGFVNSDHNPVIIQVKLR